MDNEGYLPVALIANFQRVRNLTTDEKLIYKVRYLCCIPYDKSSTIYIDDTQITHL